MATEFEKIDRTGLKERFVREVQRKIFAGELLPGEQLPPERELAAQMGISRSLINVGILDLESKGFVEVVPRTGTFVQDYRRNPTPETLAALMHYDSESLDYSLFKSLVDTRLLVQRECVRLSVEQKDPAVFAGMQEALERMNTESRDELVEALFDFHYELTKASGNLIYPMIYSGFKLALHHLMVTHLQEQPNPRKYVRMHEVLLTALIAEDAPAADDAIVNIMDTSINVLKKHYLHRNGKRAPR